MRRVLVIGLALLLLAVVLVAGGCTEAEMEAEWGVCIPNQAIGNVTGTVGSLLVHGCNDTLVFTSDDGSMVITAWEGNTTVNFAVAGGGGGCADVFETIIGTAGTDPVAGGCNDILNLVSTDGTITITGTAATDTLDFVLTNTYLQNIVEDITPQLGGNLDGQTFTVTAEGITSTIPNNTNKVGLTVNQNDTTNNPVAAFINNDSTSHGLSIQQDGILAAIQNGLYVRTTADQDTSDLVHFYSSNAGSSRYVLKLTNAGTGAALYVDQDGNGEGILVNNDGTNHGLYVSQGGVNALNDYALFVYSTVAQVNSPLVRFGQSHAGSTQDVLDIYNAGTGSGIFINQDGNAPAIEIDSEATTATGITADFQNASGDVLYLGVGGAEVFAVDWQGNVTIANAYSLPITDGGLNDVLTTNGAGIVSWAAGGGGGCADVFKTIDCPAGTDPVASGCDDTLTLLSDGNMTITGNAAAGSVTFAMTPAAFSGYLRSSLFDADTFLYAAVDDTPVATSPANVLAALSGHAAAGFSWGNQTLTDVAGVTSPAGIAISALGGAASLESTGLLTLGSTASNMIVTSNGWITISALGSSIDLAATELTIDAPVYISEQAAAGADFAGWGQIWVKNDAPNTLWFTDDAGTDSQVAMTTDLASYIPNSLFNAQTILAATVDDTPAAVTVNEQTVVGRLTGGNITALTVAQLQSLIFSAALPESVTITIATLSGDNKYVATEAVSGTLGETVAYGEVVYLKSADSQWYLTKADDEVTSRGKIGVCLDGGGDNDSTTIMLRGTIRADAKIPALTVGDPVFLSAATGGAVTVTAPSGTTGYIVRVIGYGNTADELCFCPDNMWLELS